MNESDVELSNVAHEKFHVSGDSFCGVPERQCTTIRGNYDRAVKSTSLAQWFNKYHAGLEVMGSILMGDFHI